MNHYILGITGASGSLYAQRFIKFMVNNSYYLHVITSNTGKIVIEEELECKYDRWKNQFNNTDLFIEESQDNLFANISSGSFKTKGMIILPCSMGTLGRVANGISNDLISRAADVTLKENRPLILCVRESPYNEIHLKNMLQISRAGGTILPLSPGFYNKPQSISEIIDSQIARILDLLHIDNDLMTRWTGNKS